MADIELGYDIDSIGYIRPRLSRLIAFVAYVCVPELELRAELLEFRARNLAWDDGYPMLKQVSLGQPITTLWRLRTMGVIYGTEKIPEDWVEPG